MSRPRWRHKPPRNPRLGETWQDYARFLGESGWSSRDIAAKLGKHHTTIQVALNSEYRRDRILYARRLRAERSPEDVAIDNLARKVRRDMVRETQRRDRLPNRRATETVEFRFQEQKWFLNIGRYDDGRLAEVFASSAKTTSALAAAARDAAILISIALQHGVPLETLRGAITRLENDEPASIAGRILDELGATS